MADSPTYDGLTAEELAQRLGVPRAVVRRAVGSTLDVAHELAAEGAPAGTLVLADEQTAGRGRGGRAWASAPGAGIWLTLVERPTDRAALDVLSLRVGLRAARVLDRFTGAAVRLKWPNDLYVGPGKLAGILIESRWRDQRIDWVAIGVGVNVRRPAGVEAAAWLTETRGRTEVLAALVPALRTAAAARGPLTDSELTEWAVRDLARGRRCRAPVAGVVRGIDAHGLLVVGTSGGDVTARAGSLVFDDAEGE